MEGKKGIDRRGFLKTAAIPVAGDRYNAEQQRQVGR